MNIILYNTQYQDGGNAFTTQFKNQINCGLSYEYKFIITNNGNGSAFDSYNDEEENNGNAFTIIIDEIDEGNAIKTTGDE